MSVEKHFHKDAVNQKPEHVDGVSFRELVDGIRICFYLQNKMCPFLKQGIYVDHFVL